MSFPVNWEGWAALVSILATSLGLLWWIFRYFHNDIIRRIDLCEVSIASGVDKLSAFEAWQRDMEDEHLPSTYARKDIVDLQFKEARESNMRVENLVKEIKVDMKESMHAMRHDVITLLRKDLP